MPAVLPCAKKANESMLKVWPPEVPGAAVHTKSVPTFLPATLNSPFAQSPIICIPALPSITIEVATFQSRPGELASMN